MRGTRRRQEGVAITILTPARLGRGPRVQRMHGYLTT